MTLKKNIMVLVIVISFIFNVTITNASVDVDSYFGGPYVESTLKIFDGNSYKELFSLPYTHTMELVYSISNDSKYLAVSDNSISNEVDKNYDLNVWDIKTGTKVASFSNTDKDNFFINISFSEDNSKILAYSGKYHIFDLNEKKEIFTSNSDEVVSFYNSSNKLVCANTTQNIINTIDLTSNKIINSIKVPFQLDNNNRNSIKVLNDGKINLLKSQISFPESSYEIYTFDIEKNQCEAIYKTNTAITLRDDNTFKANKSNNYYVFDLTQKKVKFDLNFEDSSNIIEINDNKLLVIKAGEYKVVDLTTGNAIYQNSFGYTYGGIGVDSLNKNIIFNNDQDTDINIVEIQKGLNTHKIKLDTKLNDAVASFAFTPDNKYLVVGVSIAEGATIPQTQITTSTINLVSNTKLGDVNEDGRITSTDVALVVRHLLGNITLKGQSFVNANVNGDKVVSSTDAALIERFNLGLIKVWN